MPAVDGELSVRKLSNKSPPLPELTVMCGGRRGAKEPLGAIVKLRGRGKNYIQKDALIYGLLLSDVLIGIVETTGMWKRDRRNALLNRIESSSFWKTFFNRLRGTYV